MHSDNSVAIIGAGPAGLTAAYLLAKSQVPVTVLEADPTYVGGISRTARYKGFHFDIGGHRFFSKSKEVEDFWTEILPDDMLERPRLSRIYYRGKFFSYPLKATEALLKLGILESMRSVLSYFKARLFPVREPKNFEDWVSNQFGKRLFNIFFKTYTEKVWGMSCKEISADWAAQRIKGLSLKTAILNAILPRRKPKTKDNVIKTLIDSFRYPRKGPGMMWESCARKVKEMGGTVLMGRRVVGCAWDEEQGEWTVTHKDAHGEASQTRARHVISSAPIRQLAHSITPHLSGTALAAADSLKYRDFLTVMLILKDRNHLADNWIYIHDPSVKVGRVQNFKSWSPEMVPDPEMACYGLEYFCFEGDGLWSSTDEMLIERAKTELEQIGLAKAGDVLDGCVVRQQKAYPVYDEDYADHVAAIRDELEARFPTMHLVGRNGMHKYNNQDHAMMTAMLCVKNILAGKPIYDLWKVNQDAEYHESGSAGEQVAAGGLRMVPTKVSSAPEPALAPAGAASANGSTSL
jgi:protoporphyrinogen oxidase